MDKNFNEGKQKIEDKPDVDHLDVGRFRQVVGDIDEHGGQHKHCLKKKNYLNKNDSLPVRFTVTTASKKKGLKKFVA